MISEAYFEIEREIKEKRTRLKQICHSTQHYLNDYFKNVANDVDIYAETILSKKMPEQIDDIAKINETRKLILDKLKDLEQTCIRNTQFFNLKENLCHLAIENDINLISNEIQRIKRRIFDNKWIFFRANKRIKSDQIDFGRLIIIQEIFTDELMHHFNKIGDYDNPPNLKRFILSKNSNILCNNYMKLYAIAKQISLSLKNPSKTIIEITHEDIDTIDEINFERYELNAIDEQLVKENEFVKLKTLDLNHNKISQLRAYSFLNLNNLKHLILSFNKLERLESNAFESLLNLEQLDLSNNKISFIASDAFLGLKNLKYLDLSGNRLAEIEPIVFNRLSQLNELDLSCNNFKIITNFMFSYLVNLEQLYLNSNEIEIVEENALNKLCNLKELHMSMNKLEKLDNKVFNHELNGLFKIDFRYNEIKILTPELFQNLKCLKLVLLYGNIDLIHEIDQKGFYRVGEDGETVNYLTFDGNYYESEEEMDEDEEEESDDEMEYNSESSDDDDEGDNYDSDY
ncbi:unnamed protein product [Brachionus calyciflorus]|uniref:Uncharacterized protein n=1 Tax=Brachionus calyciflorus TaxID=104777 RepID=A0A814AXW5_9BILA|nr:unnamed protein product [Brachionus calyciflorus]